MRCLGMGLFNLLFFWFWYISSSLSFYFPLSGSLGTFVVTQVVRDIQCAKRGDMSLLSAFVRPCVQIKITFRFQCCLQCVCRPLAWMLRHLTRSWGSDQVLGTIRLPSEPLSRLCNVTSYLTNSIKYHYVSSSAPSPCSCWCHSTFSSRLLQG